MSNKTLTKVAGMALGLAVLLPGLAYAASISVQSLSPGSSVNAGTPVSFSVSQSGLTNPSYTVSDSFASSSVAPANINASTGAFSWTPTTTDIGTHTLTVEGSGTQGDSATTSVNVTVAPSLSIAVQSLSPSNGSALALSPVTFTATSSGFSNPSYSVSDSFLGTTLASGDISSSTGTFSWTPQSSDIGTHTLTVMAHDGAGHSMSTTLTITVENGSLSINSVAPGTTIMPGTALTFTASAPNLTNPVYSIADSFSGTTLVSGDLNSSTGAFSWTPTTTDAGSHTLTVSAQDNSDHSATSSLTVSVSAPSATSTGLTPQQARFVQQFIRRLFRGFHGFDVSQLQQILQQQGLYTGPVTGYFGSQTQAAVGRFQHEHGLPAVGQVGPQTLAALNQVLVDLVKLQSTLTASSTVTTGTTTTGTTTATSSAPWWHNPFHFGHFPWFGSHGTSTRNQVQDSDNDGQ